MIDDAIEIKVPRRFFHMGLSRVSQIVALRIITLTDYGARPCDYSSKQAAEDLEISRQQYARALAQLRAAKLIATSFNHKTGLNTINFLGIPDA